MEASMVEKNPNHLLMVWTSGDREVALKMVFMYTYNAKVNNWWEQLTLLVWGPSTSLLAGDEELKAKVKEMQDAGVRVIACRSCAEKYDLVQKIETLGIEVFYSGEFLTEWVRSENPRLTF
jgi:hypothetical protein